MQPGDRVGLWLKNRPEFIITVLGILHAGAVVVPINNFLKPDEVAFMLDDAGIELLVTEADLAAHAPVRYLRLNIFPDGGIARLRAFGRVA